MLKELLEWIKHIFIAFIIVFVIWIFGDITRVNGYSMNPTLNDNDILIMNNIVYKFNQPERGDIVIIRTDEHHKLWMKKHLVKRVIAIPNDTLLISDGKVYVNDNLLEENYINEEFTSGDINIVIPSGKIFVMGDNRNNSLDSRSELIGLVDYEDIKGKAIFRFYPLNRLTNFTKQE